MALLETHFDSNILGMKCSMNVILPQRTMDQLDRRGIDGGDHYAALYLLHGLSDDHSTWLRRTSIERYAEAYNLAIIMPAVHRSFYTDMQHGLRYWTFIAEELPRICESMFKISPKREHRFAAGLSMGGYGAFKLGLRCPDKFAAVASLSGVMDFENYWQGKISTAQKELESIFGSLEEFKNSANDLFHLAEQCQSEKKAPDLYMWCGTEDFLYEGNLNFKAHLEKIKLPFAYSEGPGDHSWMYWDEQIQKVLEWLPIP